MSITAVAVATATPEPLSHPIWCDLTLCVNAEGESMLHKHAIGSVSGVQVTVERIDDYDAENRPRAGKVEVNVYSRENGLPIDRVDALTTLLTVAKMFAAEVA